MHPSMLMVATEKKRLTASIRTSGKGLLCKIVFLFFHSIYKTNMLQSEQKENQYLIVWQQPVWMSLGMIAADVVPVVHGNEERR